MLYREDPKSGNQLSILGLGCMRFVRGITGQIDIDRAEALCKAAVEAGVNYFDTAYVYGGSEQALGQVFARNPGLRTKIYLATKLPVHNCKAYEDFDKIFGQQLERLRTDNVDYYLIHNLTSLADWEGLVALGIEGWIQEKKAAGQIKQLGFSFHGTQVEFFKLLEAWPWEFVQIQYNYSNENYQAGRLGLQKAHEMGLPVIIMEPLLGGKLANGLPKKAEQLLAGAAPDRSPASWAMRWIWDQPECTLALSGMNAPEQLEDNVKTANESPAGCLDERERQALQSAGDAFRETFKIPCTGCNYCMPCPKGVNIPGCFAAYNASRAVGLFTGFQQYFSSTDAVHPATCHSPYQCVQCGQCEKKCPQNIAIMARLRDVRKKFEPRIFHTVLKLAAKRK
ncbi:MAG: aldo/keto reductase [Oscillospiraceae bacterium]|jgi:predicted aldo/keto reductase-like oxidoreductase|nr:aldo/keto reductase [Oscillospiraceae bacterium]